MFTHKLEITDLVFGGDGIGKLNGKVCFVPLTAPGDVVEISIVEEKPDYSRGQIQSFHARSSLRTEPPCPHYASCGGCNWQHLEYSAQLEMKEKLVTSLFRRSFGDTWIFRGIEGSPKSFHYRNKIGLKWNGEMLGYFQRRSHLHGAIEQCLIAEHSINDQLPEKVQELLQRKEPADLEKTYFIYAHHDESTHDLRFSQVNDEVNGLLKADVATLIPELPPIAFYDFYAGHGNFTFHLYEHLKATHQVVPTRAVEYDEKMVEEARRLAGKRKIQFYRAQVENYLRRESLPEGAFVVLDPPRGGCDPLVMDALAHSKACKIIYISCNPATLHRDLKILTRDDAFRLQSLRCFDMFPQTDHVEVVAEIVPN